MNGLSRANRKPLGEYARRSGHFVNKGRHMNVCTERALMRQAGWYRRNIASCPSNDLLGQVFIGEEAAKCMQKSRLWARDM